MTRLVTLATFATIVVLLAVITINLIQVNSRPPIVDNGWREPPWFPAQPALSAQ